MGGEGAYSMDVFGASFTMSTKIKYSLLFDRLSINHLDLDILFEQLQLNFECLMGCGETSDAINENLSELATEIFNKVWDTIQPVLVPALENKINDILHDIKVTDIITSKQLRYIA